MLIIIRRLSAVLLLPVFLLLFVATLTVFRVNATLLDADFYTDTIERLDVYTSLYDEALPAAIEERGVDLADLPLGLDLTPDGVAGYAARVLPPDWPAENVGGAIEQAVPYLTGETDSFEITLRLDDRVEAADVVVRDLLREARIHAYLFDEVVRPRVEENKEAFSSERLPFNPGLTTDEIVDGVKEVVPEEWLKERIEDVLDQVVPYMIGKDESFAVRIPLEERADAGIVVVGGWLNRSLESGGAYDYLLEEQIAPVVSASLGSAVALPYGVAVTDDEIVAAISQVLPPDWVQARVADAIGAFGPYMTGRTDSFVLSIPLEDRAVRAAKVLEDAVDAKFAAVYAALPRCTAQQLLGLGDLTLAELPECRPPLVSYAQLKTLVGLDIVDELATAIVDPLPDSIEVTEQSLQDAFGDTSDGMSVDDVRGYLRDGYTFTDDDLRGLLERFDAGDTDVVAKFDEYRGYLRDGITFDSSSVASELGDDIERFDRARGWVSTGRGLLFLLVVLLAFIALIVGFLGGRRWGTRLVWAGVPVLISGALVGGIFSVASGPLRTFSDGPIRNIDVTPVLTDKLLDVRDDLVAVFVDPIATQGLVTAALGFIMIVAGVFWARRPAALAVAPTASVPRFETEQARAAGLVVEGVREALEAEAPERPEPGEEPDEAPPEEYSPVEETPHDEAVAEEPGEEAGEEAAEDQPAEDAPEEPEEDGPGKPRAGA